MKWYTLINENEWKIETTLVNRSQAYSWRNNLLKITHKLSREAEIIVDSFQPVTYLFNSGVANEELLVDLSDIMSSYSGGVINISDFTGQLIEWEWEKKLCLPITDIDYDYTLKNIPFIPGLPFYYTSQKSMQWLGSNLEWHDMQFDVSSNINLQDYVNLYGFGGKMRTIVVNNSPFTQQFSYQFQQNVDEVEYTNLDAFECGKEYKLVMWLGRFGTLKSWYFMVESIKQFTDSNIDFVNLFDGFSLLKNKRQDINIIHNQARKDVQLYLSDIVLADDIFIVNSNDSNENDFITIKDKNFEVDYMDNKQDIKLTINYKKYDTI